MGSRIDDKNRYSSYTLFIFLLKFSCVPVCISLLFLLCFQIPIYFLCMLLLVLVSLIILVLVFWFVFLSSPGPRKRKAKEREW